MSDFNYRETTTEKNCGNCYQGIYHLSRGLICGYSEGKVSAKCVCGLYIAQSKPEAVEVKQEELF